MRAAVMALIAVVALSTSDALSEEKKEQQLSLEVCRSICSTAQKEKLPAAQKELYLRCFLGNHCPAAGPENDPGTWIGHIPNSREDI